MSTLVRKEYIIDYLSMVKHLEDKFRSIEGLDKNDLIDYFFYDTANGIIREYDVGQYEEYNPLDEDGNASGWGDPTSYAIHKTVRDYLVNDCGLTDEDSINLHLWW